MKVRYESQQPAPAPGAGKDDTVDCRDFLTTRITLIPEIIEPDELHGEVTVDLPKEQYELLQSVDHKERGSIPTLCKAPIIVQPPPGDGSPAPEQDIPLSLSVISVKCDDPNISAVLQVDASDTSIATTPSPAKPPPNLRFLPPSNTQPTTKNLLAIDPMIEGRPNFTEYEFRSLKFLPLLHIAAQAFDPPRREERRNAGLYWFADLGWMQRRGEGSQTLPWAEVEIQT